MTTKTFIPGDLHVLDKAAEILDKGGCVETIYCDFIKANNWIICFTGKKITSNSKQGEIRMERND